MAGQDAHGKPGTRRVGAKLVLISTSRLGAGWLPMPR